MVIITQFNMWKNNNFGSNMYPSTNRDFVSYFTYA